MFDSYDSVILNNLPPRNFLSREPWDEPQTDMLTKVAMKRACLLPERSAGLRIRGVQPYPRPIKGVYGEFVYYILRNKTDLPLLAFFYKTGCLDTDTADENKGELRIMQLFAKNNDLPRQVSANCAVTGTESVLAKTLLSWILQCLLLLKRKGLATQPNKRISDYLTKENAMLFDGFWIEVYYSGKEGLIAKDSYEDDITGEFTDKEWEAYRKMLAKDHVIEQNVF